MLNFRTLRADEIETRAARCTEKGVQLLLYKDSRADMNLLDETVGPENWQRRHDEHNGNLFCSVGINVNYANSNLSPVWIWKEDAGAESNTEAEKGHASDSFKRACVNFGIGRELYTSPFIWIAGAAENRNGKWVCSVKFHVSEIEYDDKRRISRLVISDRDGVVAYQMGKPKEAPPAKPEPPKAETMKFICEECGNVLKPYTGKDGKKVGVRQHAMGSQAKFEGHIYCLDCIKKRQGA